MPKGPNGRKKGKQRNPFARRPPGPLPKGNIRTCPECDYMTVMFGNRAEAVAVYGGEADLHAGSTGVHRQGEIVVNGKAYYD